MKKCLDGAVVGGGLEKLGDVEIGAWYRKVDIRLQDKGNSKLPWRKAGQPTHLVDVADSDQ